MELKPEQAVFMRDMILPNMEREQQSTLRVLEAVPADKADYKPDANSMSALDLSWHIASAENLFLSAIINGAFDFTPRDKAKTMAETIAFYKETCAKNVAAIKTMTGDQLAKVVDFRGMMQMPAVSFMPFNVNHIVHHRGQLSVYLRPMGGKVPAIYGESYDSKAAKAAKG